MRHLQIMPRIISQFRVLQLINYLGNAVIRCSLVTSEDENRMPHAHHLIKREGNQELDDFHEIEVSEEFGHVAAFNGMGIIHTAKKNIKDELVRKKKIEALEKLRQKNVNVRTLSVTDLTKINQEAEEAAKNMNLNSVALCFQAFYRDANGVLQILTDPVYSHPINNLKSALTGELKICRIDKHTSSCEGNEEIFILVEKVGKKNIKIKFYELDDSDNEVWYDYGKFSELDVHHQYAIVFRTPAYKDTNIRSHKDVFIKLERPSDGECSNSVKFTYKASEKLQKNKKRSRVSDSTSGSLEFSSSQNVNENLNKNSQMNTEELMWLLKDATLPSEELELAIDNIDMDKFVDKNDPGENVCDGPEKRDNSTFARDVLIEILEIIKNKNPHDIKDKIMELLKELTVYGDTPLHAALRCNQPDITNTLLVILGLHSDFKALANAENSLGKTPLHYAVIQNEPQVVKALLMLGADPNFCDENDSTPLHVAVTYPECAACVDVLLTANPNLEARDEAGWVPLHLAAKAGSLSAVKSLIKSGAEVNSTDVSYGRTALHIAVEGSHSEIVEYLLKETKIEVNKKNFGGNTALHSAVVMSGARAKEICELLIRHGADPSVSNREPAAVEEGCDAGIKTELESDDEDPNGQTSFDLAKSKLEILELLQGKVRKDETGENVEVKEEVIEEAEPRNNFNNEDMLKLAKILDKTGGWKKLAERMGHGILVPVLSAGTTSPSLTLLSYINNVGKKVLDILTELKEKEAVAELQEMFKNQRINE
ncbi:nuclear factor NF-kappa-B p100 subunit isoform X2 [Belonocnema kinseyi]|uniref:nuclear factor NF-kappa-B p100 subunit isoform X2 n=1 Tax=Belonocnema kinseyi TaxID=2817044 RepID=UPI00143D1EFE|nr:nuclear factor NF-kappa-B p100 subunit isoform X2 [Belonocnema kinseyi]